MADRRCLGHLPTPIWNTRREPHSLAFQTHAGYALVFLAALALAVLSYSAIDRVWGLTESSRCAIPELPLGAAWVQGNHHPCTTHSPSMVVTDSRSDDLTASSASVSS